MVLRLFPRGNPRAKADSRRPKGGEAVSTYEIIIVIFWTIASVIALITLMVYIVDLFSKRK